MKLIYGEGLRLAKCICLRVEHQVLTVHGGKGAKDRETLLPEILINALKSIFQKHVKRDVGSTGIN